MPTADSYERLAIQRRADAERRRRLADLNTDVWDDVSLDQFRTMNQTPTSSFDTAEFNRFRTISDLSRGPVRRAQPGDPTTNPYIGVDGGPGPNASVAELEAYVRQRYGYMAGFLNIPEVRDVLMNAARNGWGPEELYGALSQTSWWRSTSAAARTWQQLVNEDPAEANRQAQEIGTTISDVAKQYGLRLSGGQVSALAVEAAKHGWSAEQQIDAILKNVNWDTLEGGAITSSRDRVKALASQYMVRLSETTARNYAERIARGELTEEGVVSIFQQQAKARFSYMSDLIDTGVTPNDYFAPSRDVIASTLEVGADTIDMMDPKWLGVLEVRGDDGQLRAATMNEAMLAARKRPEWADTRNAQELTASMVSGLAQAFGRAG